MFLRLVHHPRAAVRVASRAAAAAASFSSSVAVNGFHGSNPRSTAQSLANDESSGDKTTIETTSQPQQYTNSSDNKNNTIAPAKSAVLVDAENASQRTFSLALELLENEKQHQTPVRRIYGSPRILNTESWQTIIRNHSFVQVPTNNCCADVALAIDAMDLLHTKKFLTGMVLFSSDTDFCRLVQRAKENDWHVTGVGERQKATPHLMTACDDFVFTEDLLAVEQARLDEMQRKERELQLEEKRQKAEKERQRLEQRERRVQELKQQKELKQVLEQREEFKRQQRLGASVFQQVSEIIWTLGGISHVPVVQGETSQSRVIDKERREQQTKSQQTGKRLSKNHLEALENCIQKLSNKEGWSPLGLVVQTGGNAIKPKELGYDNFSQLIRAHGDYFEIEVEPDGTTLKVRLHEKTTGRLLV